MQPDFLESSLYIDWHTPEITQLAEQLSSGLSSSADIAKVCFVYVRDNISHSWDAQQGPVTCKASEVLAAGTGFCYAKSHLLAALLRANGIPAALCYQRLEIAEGSAQFCLHGLNAIYVEEFGWFRVDARGNKPGVNAEFSPPGEKLAFVIQRKGEKDFAQRFKQPLQVVVDALNTHKDIFSLAKNLPDLAILPNP